MGTGLKVKIKFGLTSVSPRFAPSIFMLPGTKASVGPDPGSQTCREEVLVFLPLSLLCNLSSLHLFLKVLEVGMLKSGCQHSWVLGEGPKDKKLRALWLLNPQILCFLSLLPQVP